MVEGVELNKIDDMSKKSVVSFAELQATDAYAKAEGELPIAIGCDENGAVVADLCELPHLFVYSPKSGDLTSVLNAAVLSLLDKNSSSLVNFVMIDLDDLDSVKYEKFPENFFWPYPSRKEMVINEPKTALRVLDCLVREIEDRSELLRKSRTHNIKEYCEALQSGELEHSEEFPMKPYVVVIVTDFWRFANESKAAEISLGRITELGKAVGIHLVAATKEQPELMNADVLSSFPSRIVFKTQTAEASQALLFASEAADLNEGEMIFVKNKFFFGFKNPRKIMTEGSIDVDFANKVSSSPINAGFTPLSSVAVVNDDINRLYLKLQK